MTAPQKTIPTATSPRSGAAQSASRLPRALDSGITQVSGTAPRKSPSRLTVAEKAFARGLSALKAKNYPEAKRQLSGFLELTGSTADLSATEPSAKQFRRLQGIRVVVESLQLLLAISEEITILEREVR